MRILGVDPGYGIAGYGVIDVFGNRISHVAYGAITTPKKLVLPERLVLLFRDFENILEKYSPDLVAVERIYFVKSVTTALEVGHARGVILLASSMRGLKIFECSPQQVKIAVSGYGRASKRQVQEMVKRLLSLDEIPRPDDAADALAIAWCAALYGKEDPL
jgi:crossover junction endodeoxyribonuclease RuvC